MDWGRKWLVYFNGGKTQLVLFDHSSNTGAIELKMDGSVLEEKSSCKMLGMSSSFKLDWNSYIISIAISVNLLYSLKWNAVIISRLVLLAASWRY